MYKTELKQELINESKTIESYVIDTRRHIHMYPETAFEEEITAKFIEEELHNFGYNTERVAKTGVIAILKGAEGGKVVALRADIDALNVKEENDVPYRSKNPGKMHACGHDAHAAMLLGAAKILYKYKKQIPGTVKLIFQPGEEGGGGGAKIVEEGHFDDIDIVFGMHVWQDLPAGVIGTRKGALLASGDQIKITISGKGGHAASPHQTIDPTSVLIDIYNALQKVISREINPFEPRVLTTPKIVGSNAHNIIPERAILEGTFRTLNPEVRDHIIKRMKEIVEGYSKAWRCTGVVEAHPVSYPPLINDDDAVDEVKRILKELDEVQTMDPNMGSEDFSFYLEKTKGAFITLGMHNEDKGIIYPHHHSKFQVDESVLWKGTAVYTLLGFYSLFEK
jgi:amidohydrolase